MDLSDFFLVLIGITTVAIIYNYIKLRQEEREAAEADRLAGL